MAYIYQISRTLLKKKIEKYGHYTNGRVLDAGSGCYSRYKHLISHDSITRMDIAQGENVDIVGSVDDMPFKNAEFDAVLSTQVFEHLEFPEKAASEINRVLKPGGVVLLTAPQWNELHEEPHDYWRYTKYGLKSLFERNGFTVLECEQIGGFFSVRAQMTIRYLIDRYRLYNRWWGRFASVVFRFWAKGVTWLDNKDNSKANRKHTIGWVFVFKKT